MTWALPIVALTIFIFIVAPLIGLYTFSRQRAETVAFTEIEDPLAHHVTHVRLAHPEIVRTTRIDRHPAYCTINISLFTYGWIVLLGRVPYASFGTEALNTQHALGASLIIGAVLTLSGSLMGKHVGRWHIGPRRVYDNLTASKLGDDIRLPYVLGWWGLVSMLISIGFYDYTVITAVGLERLVSSLGGILGTGVAIMCITMVPIYISAIRAYINERTSLVAEARTIIAIEDDRS